MLHTVYTQKLKAAKENKEQANNRILPSEDRTHYYQEYNVYTIYKQFLLCSTDRIISQQAWKKKKINNNKTTKTT